MATLGDSVKSTVASVNSGSPGGWASFKVADTSINIGETGTGFATLAAKLQGGEAKTAAIKLENGGSSKLVFVRFASGSVTDSEKYSKAANFLKSTLGGGNAAFVEVASAGELTEANVKSKAF